MISGAAFRLLAAFHSSDVGSFVSICEQAGYPTDLGGYYLRQLVKSGHVQKLDRGQYGVLPKGKQELALYYGKQLLAPRPRLAAVVVAQQGGDYIILRRTVQPFVGVAEWPATAAEFGESTEAVAARITQDRLGCTAQTRFVGFFRRIDLYEDSVFDDKLFAVHVATIADDVAVKTSAVTGNLERCAAAKLAAIERPAKSLLDIWLFAQAGKQGFVEKRYHLSAADLGVSEQQ